MQKKTQSKIYDFNHQDCLGKQGEDIIDQWLSSNYEILNVSDLKKYQKMGIDRILTRPDGSTITLEYKFDLASAQTGNLFFETISIDKRNIPGWGWSSQADYWIFLLPTKEIIVIEPSKFRTLVWELRSQIQEKKVPNTDYNTWGVPIPLEKVKEICYYQKKL